MSHFHREKSIWASTQEKGPCGFPVCGSSKAHAESPIWATDMRFLPEAYSRSLLHPCKQQWLWRDCTYVQAHLSLCWWLMWMPLCAGSFDDIKSFIPLTDANSAVSCMYVMFKNACLIQCTCQGGVFGDNSGIIFLFLYRKILWVLIKSAFTRNTHITCFWRTGKIIPELSSNSPL